MSKHEIPEEAVEAAAKVMQAKDSREGRGDYPLREYTEDALAILEAAAPHMLAEAWESGASAQAAAYGMDKDTGPNPYRSRA